MEEKKLPNENERKKKYRKKINVIENSTILTKLLTTFEQFSHLGNFILVFDNGIFVFEKRIYRNCDFGFVQMLFESTYNV